MTIPKLSIILPAHRCDDYLQIAIESILDQDFYDFELVLILNGVPQKSLSNLQKKYTDPRIIYISTSIANLVFSLNLGISAAKAEYIVRMDSDDFSRKNRLRILWEVIESNPQIDVIGSSFNLIDSHGVFVRRSSMGRMNSDQIRRVLPFRCCIPHPTVAFKKKSVLKVGAYSFGQLSEDYDLWLRMSRSLEFKFLIIQEALLDYRIHSNQATSKNNNLNILAYDLSLKLRELIITKKLIYIPGAIFSIADFCYKYFILMKQGLIIYYKNLNIK